MPVLTRRRTTRILIVAAAVVPLLLAAGAAVISVLIGQSCSGGGGSGDVPSQLAQRDIPASFLRIYEQVGARCRIPWEILAGSVHESTMSTGIRVKTTDRAQEGGGAATRWSSRAPSSSSTPGGRAAQAAGSPRLR